jgi:exodeoxyribonuclease-3
VKIATWNVNSIRARLPAVVAWLDDAEPDLVLLQETKVTAAQFPAEPLEERGFNIAAVGETTGRNGVAILAKRPLEDVAGGLPGDDADEEARYVERFAFKLAFFDRLRAHVAALLEFEEALVIGGDYNVAPAPIDVHDPAALDGTICYHPEERAKLRALVHLGLYDAYRIAEPRTVAYSWWHYQGRAYKANQGLRIDHLLLSPQAADRLETAAIDAAVRGGKAPSDHVPVWCRLSA